MSAITPEQRQNLFIEMLNEATRQTGIQIIVMNRTRSLENGKLVMVEAELGFALVPGWVEEADPVPPQSDANPLPQS